MAIFMLDTTKDVLGPHADECDSRSLFKDRYADPQAREDERKKWFRALIKKAAEPIQRSAWLPPDPGSATIHARLMFRLMVDLAGGVMENANLNLDRYGLPRIPGSAVKGIARRMALQALHDWIAAGSERPATDDVCAPCCEPFTTPARMLAAIARIFGWTPDDWKTEKSRDKKAGNETTYKSDFAWASGGGLQPPSLPQIKQILTEARDLIPSHETSAGTIAFLEAAPNTDPKLELDVLTPHHTKYHEGDPAYATAPDTEDPIPVYFPAVKPQKEGEYFTFPLIPLRLAASGDLVHAKLWLAHGLELLGIGAKTNAGYGWFQIDTRVSARIAIETKQREESLAANRLEPCPEITRDLTALTDQQLAGILNAYSFDPSFWPKDKSPLYEVTLLHHVFTNAEHLRLSKKGSKAIEQLSNKYNRNLT